MRYLLVTYDETNLPSKDYDLFAQVGEFLAGEGLDEAGIADLHAPSGVQEHIQADILARGGSLERQTLLSLLPVIDAVEDELGLVEVTGGESRERFEAVIDLFNNMRERIEDALAPVYPASPEITSVHFDEAAGIPSSVWKNLDDNPKE